MHLRGGRAVQSSARSLRGRPREHRHSPRRLQGRACGSRPICRAARDMRFVSSSVAHTEDRQAVSVVITSMPLRYSMGSEATPSPKNSSILFLTKPHSNTAADNRERHVLRTDAGLAVRRSDGRLSPRARECHMCGRAAA